MAVMIEFKKIMAVDLMQNPVGWLRRLRSGYAAVTNETRVVTQVTQFLGFLRIHVHVRAQRLFIKKLFSCIFKTIRNCVTCVTTRFLFVTG